MNRFEQFANVFGRRRSKDKTATAMEMISDDDFFAVLHDTSYDDKIAVLSSGVGLQPELVVSNRFTESVSQDVLRASSGLLSSVGGLAGLFTHGGAFCAHCVATVGSSVGGVSKIGVPGIGLGHWHGDTWHAEGHDDEEKKRHAFGSSPKRPSQKSVSKKPIHAPAKRNSYSTESISVSDFVTSWFCPNAY